MEVTARHISCKPPHLGLQGLPQHEGVAEVVDVLGSTREVRELEHFRELGVLGEALLEDVLHGLHVVVGRPLDLLHGQRVLRREGRRQLVDVLDPRRRLDLGERLLVALHLLHCDDGCVE